MMEELDVNSCLTKEDLFDLFKNQLKKDFEGAGLDGSFAVELSAEFEKLKLVLLQQLQPLLKNNATALSSLLYRVDISETQLRNYKKDDPEFTFEEAVAELIIKRVLQKVILKKTFSNK